MKASPNSTDRGAGSTLITPVVVFGVAAVVFGYMTAALGEEPSLAIDGAAERIAAHRADARLMAQRRLPTPADLGSGWFRPWEVPAKIPRLVASENHYWRRFVISPEWAQYFGLEKAEIVAALRGQLDRAFAEMSKQEAAVAEAGAEVPPEMAEILKSKPAALSLMVMQGIRQHTMLVHRSKTLAAAQLQGSTGHILEVAKARAAGKSQEEIDAITAAGMWPMLKAMGADLRGRSDAAAYAAIADEIRSVRRGTRMVYVHASPDELKAAAEDPKKLPTYARFAIDLHVVARDAIGRELPDLTPDNLDATRKSFVTSLTKAMEFSREMAEVMVAGQIAEERERGGSGAEHRIGQMEESLAVFRGLTPPAATLEIRDFGDNAWVVVLDLPRIQEAKFAGVQARIRVGHAVAHIEATGTASKEFLTQSLDAMLAALEESLTAFSDDS